MQVIFNPKTINTPSAIALGNFDGVHKGHKAVLAEAKKIAKQKNIPVAVMTFEPHPLHLFRKDLLPARLTSMRTKLELLEKEGVEICYIMKFNRQFADIGAVSFIDRFLRGSHVVTGYNFAFGKAREGNADLMAKELDENYTRVEAAQNGEYTYSSSKAREFLKEGDIKSVNKILGHNYIIEGRVIHGSAKGVELGAPTANVKLKPNMVRPKYGVYAVRTNFGDGVANFGVRPTVDGDNELLEIFLFDFNQDIYGQRLRAEFLGFIREEQKFNSVDELKEQIGQDIKEAKIICGC